MRLVWLLAACRQGVEVETSGPIECANPSARDDAAYRAKVQPQAALDEALLHGGGLLAEDLDGNGYLDLFLPGESEQLLRWTREGAPDELFDVGDAALAGLPLSMAVGATAVDYDGDGDLDVYVTRWNEPNTLLRNESDRTFVDVSAEAFGDAPATTSQSASWGDLDGDGDLDLFVGTYGARIDDLNVTDPAPDCSDHRPDEAQLWRNEGDGTFTNISGQLPAAAHAYTFMSGFYDLYDDGYPELFVANDDGLCGPSVLLDNDGGRLSVVSGSFDRQTHDMGMAVGDLNGDALPDFLLTSWNGLSFARSRLGASGEVGWVDAADAAGFQVDGPSRDRPSQAQMGDQIYGWGAEFGDLDNDADLDAVALFGYWHYYTGAGNKQRQRDGLWVQGADGTFRDEARSWGLAENGVARGVVLADIDNNGFLDVIKRPLNVEGAERFQIEGSDRGIALHLANCAQEAWVRVRLQAPPPNTFAVGARVRVVAGEHDQVRWIQSGSSGMYSGAPLEAHVGLGSEERIDRLEVTWPDGAVSVVRGLAARQLVTVHRR